MEQTIPEIFNSYQQQFMEFFSAPRLLSLADIENEGMPKLQAMIRDLTQLYINNTSGNIRNDKKGRRKAGLVLERVGDERRVFTQMGELVYQRDYYNDTLANCYRYPIDEILGIASRQRVSDNVGLDLATTATEVSYAKSSMYITGGEISRQTVMRKIRNGQPKLEIPDEKRRVKYIHVDADEDHISLIGGKKGIVPLVSIYEGIGHKGKRRFCKNIIHISEYGLRPDKLWEKVLDEIDKRYDLEGVVIYLHGDGATWVRKGLEWLPKSKFVLDKYHRNKAIKAMCVGIRKKKVQQDLEKSILDSLKHEDIRYFDNITKFLINETPAKKAAISIAAKYLRNFRDAIRICEIDAEANNGGCSEPHVSHILAARLSTRPMAWSKTTLKSIVPMLAKRGELEVKNKVAKPIDPILAKAATKAKELFRTEHTLGAVAPEAIGALTAINIGKVNPLYMALRYYAN